MPRGRPEKHGPELKARALELRRNGHTILEILDLLKDEGVTKDWVGRLCKGVPIGVKSGEDLPEQGSDLYQSLRKQITDLEELRKQAVTDDEPERVAALTRAINQTVTIAAKLAPEERVSPEDDPTVVLDATKVRDKLFDLLDRALKRRAGK